MKATHNTDTQKVSVKYCSKHYNHSTQLAYITIPQRVRLDIASKTATRGKHRTHIYSMTSVILYKVVV